jgi:hypothetical protein
MFNILKQLWLKSKRLWYYFIDAVEQEVKDVHSKAKAWSSRDTAEVLSHEALAIVASLVIPKARSQLSASLLGRNTQPLSTINLVTRAAECLYFPYENIACLPSNGYSDGYIRPLTLMWQVFKAFFAKLYFGKEAYSSGFPTWLGYFDVNRFIKGVVDTVCDIKS